MLFTPRQKGLSTENFLKLNDQEEVTGIFRGEIYTFKRHWVNNRSSECIGANCLICASDPTANYPLFRFRVNILIHSNGKWIPKLFEGGGETYDLLSSLDKKFDLSRTLVDIRRRGVKQNTKYDILPRLDQPFTSEIESQLKGVSLQKLSAA